MKGMEKIKRGVSFRGVSSYVIDRDDPEKEQGQIVGGNMSGTTPAELTKEFGIAQSLRPEIEKPVWHNSLRLPRQEKITDEKWEQIADDYMEKMGFSDMHPRVYVKHDDREGQHIHIVASRVALDGEIYLGRNENLKSTKHIQNLEKKHDLIRTKPAEYENGKVVMPERKELKKGEIEMCFKEGQEPIKPPRMKLQEYVDDVLREKCTAVEFCEKLELVGVAVRPNIATTGKLNGFSFECEGIAFKGSQLGNNYKMAKLQERGLEYEQARDFKELTERKECFRPIQEPEGNGRVKRRDTKTSERNSERGLSDHRNRRKSQGNNEERRTPKRTNISFIGRVRNSFSSIIKTKSKPRKNTPVLYSSGDNERSSSSSWTSRFRQIDDIERCERKERYIADITRQRNKERDRVIQRNSEQEKAIRLKREERNQERLIEKEKKSQSKAQTTGSTRATLTKSKTSPKRDISDGLGPSI